MESTVPAEVLLPDNVFVPKQYRLTNPVVLSDFEKSYIKLIMAVAEQYVANNLLNLLIAGWYNVTFDNYPSLRPLLPANYPDTIVGLAGQVTIAIQNLTAGTDEPLREQWVPIGRRHYMHGAEAVTLLCSAPCLVQSMYNVLSSAIERVVGLLEGLANYPNLLTHPLRASKLIEPEPAAATRYTPEEEALLGSVFRDGSSGRTFESFDPPDEARPKFYDPTVSVLLMDPPALTLGKAVPGYLVDRVLAAGVSDPVPEQLWQRLTKALQALPQPVQALIKKKEAPPLAGLLDGEVDLGKLSKDDLNRILQLVVAFVLRYVLPILLIPFGRFVQTIVYVITAGVGTERSLRLLSSWETSLEPRAEELARRFWWTLLELRPDVRFSLGLQTGTQLQNRMDTLTAALAAGLKASFPRILNGGLDFKQELMDMGTRWAAAGWPTDGYDAVRRAFLDTVDAMLFAPSPVYARTVPAIRLKESYAQLASVVITELVYGAGGNTFRPVGGILGIPKPSVEV